MDLVDRSVLITGGKRIGVAVATELARQGAHIALSYNHSKEDAETAAAAVRALSRHVVVNHADLNKPSDCEALVKLSAKSLGRLDAVVNMASLYLSKPFDDLTERDWELGLAVDLTASFLCSRAAVPHMRAVGGGRIINFSDWIAKSGRPRYKGYVPYYVAKSAVIALTECLAFELAADNILVNAIAPGPIRPPEGLNSQVVEEVERVTPLGRWGGDGEIVKAVLALIETDFITGETIRVDGGRHLL